MATFEDDWIAFKHLGGVLEVLGKVLEERLIPGLCTSQVLAGDSIALEPVSEDCASMGWARLASVFPSSQFPNPDVGRQNGVTQFASTIELGVVRYFEAPDNAEPASVEQQFDASRLAAADMGAMLTAICAYCDARDIPVSIGSYAPIGPQGLVLGGAWTATLAAV